MSEGEHQNHAPDKLQRHDGYTEAKERLTKLVEQFDFELTEFRNTWIDESDMEDATKEIASRMGCNLKKVRDELDLADGKQRECTLVTDIDDRSEEAAHTRMMPLPRRENSGASSTSRSGLKSILIEVIGDWDKCLHVRYHNGGNVKTYAPAPQPFINLKNKSDQTLRCRLFKARVAARNPHPNGETKNYNGPAPSPGYQWTRRYGTPPRRFAELNDDQVEPEKGYWSNANIDRKRELEEEGEEVEEDSDESDHSFESDDESDDESRNEISNVGDDGSHLNLKRSREDDNEDELREEKEESPQPRLKKPRTV